MNRALKTEAENSCTLLNVCFISKSRLCPPCVNRKQTWALSSEPTSSRKVPGRYKYCVSDVVIDSEISSFKLPYSAMMSHLLWQNVARSWYFSEIKFPLFERDGKRSLCNKSDASRGHESLSPFFFCCYREGLKQAERKKGKARLENKSRGEKVVGNMREKWDERGWKEKVTFTYK